MKTERTEASSPLNEDSDTVLPFIKTRRAKTKDEKRANAKLVGANTSSTVKKHKKVTFDVALAKALPVRARQLGRRLERDDFVRLRNAVRKQCTRVNSDVFSKRLTVLEERVNELDCHLGPDPGVRAVRMIQLFNLQMDIARQQLLDLMQESTALSEGCSHVAGKRRLAIPKGGYEVQVRGPGFPQRFVTLNGGSRLSCCQRCLSSREDLIFESFGLEKFLFTTGTPEVLPDTLSFGFFRYEKPPPSFEMELHPLLFQELWAELLDVKFGRDAPLVSPPLPAMQRKKL
jgi:hypothetical protein